MLALIRMRQLRIKMLYLERRVRTNKLREILVNRWHKHVAVKGFKQKLRTKRSVNLARKAFQGLTMHARIRLAAYAKLSLIQAYFRKRK